MYSNRTEFDRHPKPNTTPIFCPLKIWQKYFKLCKIPQKRPFEGMASFGKFSYAKVGCAIPHSKGLQYKPMYTSHNLGQWSSYIFCNWRLAIFLTVS